MRGVLHMREVTHPTFHRTRVRKMDETTLDGFHACATLILYYNVGAYIERSA